MSQTPDIARPALLVVDDDPTVRKTLSRQLQGVFRVVTADGYSEGISKLEAEGDILALISDSKMGPGPGGKELIAEAQARFPHVHRIVVSGNLPDVDREQLVSEGVIHKAFNKPWNHDELLATLTDCCEVELETQDVGARTSARLDPRQQPRRIFVGMSRLSANASPTGTNTALMVEIAVTKDTHEILDVAFHSPTRLGEKYLADLMVGKTAPEAIVEAIAEFKESYVGESRKALAATLEDLLRKFRTFEERPVQ